MRKPLVSIGMAVCNGAATVGQSVRSLLRQTLTDWELHVFDDGSTDGSADVIRQYDDPRIVLHRDGRRLGLAARLNQAVAIARGEFFARMDADDVSYPRRLELQLGYLTERAGVDLVGGQVIVFASDGTVKGVRRLPERHHEICRSPTRGFPVVHPAFFGPVGWFRGHRYDESLARCQDQDLLLRTHRTSTFANVPEILLGYRENLVSAKLVATRCAWAHVLQRELRRQGHPWLGYVAKAKQCLKMLYEIAAIRSGLGYAVMRHRAVNATASELAEWRSVLQVVGPCPARRPSLVV